MKKLFFLLLFVTTAYSTQPKPPCEEVYDKVIYYGTQYSVPHIYIFRVLKKETGYCGNTHTEYSPKKLESKRGALGPMQVLPSTALSVWGINKKRRKEVALKLQVDIDYNIHTAVKYISDLYKKYKDWKIVFSVYNQGLRGTKHINRYAHLITKAL